MEQKSIDEFAGLKLKRYPIFERLALRDTAKWIMAKPSASPRHDEDLTGGVERFNGTIQRECLYAA